MIRYAPISYVASAVEYIIQIRRKYIADGRRRRRFGASAFNMPVIRHYRSQRSRIGARCRFPRPVKPSHPAARIVNPLPSALSIRGDGS